MNSATFEVEVLEEAGKETTTAKPLIIKSHWRRNGWNGMVILKYGTLNVSVSARELVDAVERCHNFK